MQESISPEEDVDWKELLGLAGRLACEGLDRPSFLARIRTAGPTLMPDIFGGGQLRPQDAQRFAGALGYAIWRAMPHPDHGWRPVPTPLPGRNDPCFCGSGQKYKRCCATVPIPSGIFEHFNMLRYVLDAIPASRLGDIPHDRLEPLALADTAQQWLAEGDASRAAQLLEPLFETPERLNARHADALDALMDTWLALHRPRNRTALVDSLVEHPDPEIANTARQHKVTMLADARDWNGAWSLFQSALRRSPDHPSFAHLEVTLLLAQGREDEALSRAQFWAQRLRRLDPEYADYAQSILELAKDPEASPDHTGSSMPAVIAAGRERLVQIGGDPVRAHGAMVAAALAPDMASPAGWLSLLLKPSAGFEPAFADLDDANRVIGGLTAWYNAIAGELGPAAPGGPRVGVLARPWLDERTSDAVSRWAAGFMAGVAAEPSAWRRLGLANDAKLLAPLRQLAARAPLSATEKADPSRLRDRIDDDAPLLALVDDSDPVELLDHALTSLVEFVGRQRAEAAARRR